MPRKAHQTQRGIRHRTAHMTQRGIWHRTAHMTQRWIWHRTAHITQRWISHQTSPASRRAETTQRSLKVDMTAFGSSAAGAVLTQKLFSPRENQERPLHHCTSATRDRTQWSQVPPTSRPQLQVRAPARRSTTSCCCTQARPGCNWDSNPRSPGNMQRQTPG